MRLGLLIFATLAACSDSHTAFELSVCGRGDRAALASRLERGSFEVRALSESGSVLLSTVTPATGATAIAFDVPAGAMTMDVSALDSEGVLVASGQGVIESDEACVCLALDGDRALACDAVACVREGEACRFYDSPVLPTCALIEGAETIIDNSSPCFELGGTPEFLRTHDEGFGGDLDWTHTTAASEVDNHARWRLHFAEAGRYRVEAFTVEATRFPETFNPSASATYEIVHESAITRVPIDQGEINGWTLLGEFEFLEGGAQSVRLGDNTGENPQNEVDILFDALRVTPVASAAKQRL